MSAFHRDLCRAVLYLPYFCSGLSGQRHLDQI